jgi:glucosylceramidase
LVLAVFPISTTAVGPTVEVWVSQVNSTNTGMLKGLEKQSDLQFNDDNGTRISNLIAVNENNTYQVMDGFGASITEASAYLYQNILSSSQKSSLMNALFDKENGIGLSMLRQPIGATDHCVAPYNFAPTAQADSLPYFNFSPELATIFPTVQDALAVEPGRIKIIASSWSPPGWMKQNNSELGMYNGIKGTLKTDKYQAYANYITKFIQEYESRGIDIYAVTPTNEPDHASYDWPALPMTHTEAQNLVKNYLYPTLCANNLDTKIICWDHSYTTTNYKDGAYPFNFYSDADAMTKTDGSAWHWYEGDEEVMSVVRKEFPNKDLWFTEGSGGEWGFPKWKTAFLNQSSSVINIARNWCKSIIYWNLALDQNGGPDYYYDVYQQHDSTNRGLVTINTNTNSWEYNVDYYTLGHISKFVHPGAVRIESTSLDNNIETVAFKNPDGSKVLVLTNLIASAQNIKVLWGNQSFTYQIPAESMVSMKWSGNQASSALQPIWFNNLENNQNYSPGTSSSTSSAAGTANLNSTTCIMLTTTADGDPGVSKQCAIIRPQAGTTINASGYEYLQFSVKDMVNPAGCTIKVTFVDQNNNISSAWSHEKTVYSNWTRIWVPVGGNYGFDREHIKEIRIGFYWNGIYYVDDLSFSLGYTDGIPSLGSNLIVNGSFEDDGSKVASPKGWYFHGANPESTYLEKNSNSASGRFHVVHYSAAAHEAYTWQTVYGLENGTYTLRAKVQSGGGQTQNKVIATDFGSSERSVHIPVSTPWVQVVITNIQVTNNQCTIGFYTQGNPGDWSCMDNVEFFKN